MRTYLAGALAGLLLTGAASAQSLKPYDPETDETIALGLYPVEQLSGVLGELHYFAWACDGRDAQHWREAMQEMLELEAPTRGPFRDRLVASFNEGFRHHQQRMTRCGAAAELEERRLAIQGMALSESLRRQYIE